MGTFAGTAIVDYRLSFADQGKQTSVSELQTNGSLPFPFSVCCKQTEVTFFRLRNTENGYMVTWRREDLESGDMGCMITSLIITSPTGQNVP
jgi:hypothetical protein